MERNEKDYFDEDVDAVGDIIFGEPDSPENIEIELATVSFAKLIEKLTSKPAIGNLAIISVFNFSQP